MADAVSLGVTVTAAAGDDGSVDRTNDGAVHVDFPASSPHALACGGTRLDADATSGSVVSETVWNNGAVRPGRVDEGLPTCPPWPTRRPATATTRRKCLAAASANPPVPAPMSTTVEVVSSP